MQDVFLIATMFLDVLFVLMLLFASYDYKHRFTFVTRSDIVYTIIALNVLAIVVMLLTE